MPKSEAPLPTLSQFLPAGAYEPVSEYLIHYKVHLTITRARDSVLGDYRNAVHGRNHRISVNGNLNTYSFLITLLHELAHLVAFQQWGNRIADHGKEWKQVFREILKQFIQKKLFPADIEKALMASIHNLAASSCADDELLRVLRRYDPVRNGMKLVEEIEQGRCFEVKGGKVFRREERIRKRYRCVEVSTGRIYLFSPVYEVKDLSALA